MAVYLIKYQLNKPGKDYAKLYEALEQYEYIRDPKLHSAWFIRTDASAQKITDNVRQHADQNDDVFVTQLHRGEYAGWLHKDIWEWLTARL